MSTISYKANKAKIKEELLREFIKGFYGETRALRFELEKRVDKVLIGFVVR